MTSTNEVSIVEMENPSGRDSQEYWRKILSSGLRMHKETSDLSLMELKKELSEFFAFSHRLMQQYVHIQEQLEEKFVKITSDSRKKLIQRLDQPAKNETPSVDDIFEVIKDGYRKNFKELMDTIPTLKRNCVQFEEQLGQDFANLRQKLSELSARPLEENVDDEDDVDDEDVDEVGSSSNVSKSTKKRKIVRQFII